MSGHSVPDSEFPAKDGTDAQDDGTDMTAKSDAEWGEAIEPDVDHERDAGELKPDRESQPTTEATGTPDLSSSDRAEASGAPPADH